MTSFHCEQRTTSEMARKIPGMVTPSSSLTFVKRVLIVLLKPSWNNGRRFFSYQMSPNRHHVVRVCGTVSQLYFTVPTDRVKKKIRFYLIQNAIFPAQIACDHATKSLIFFIKYKTMQQLLDTCAVVTNRLFFSRNCPNECSSGENGP